MKINAELLLTVRCLHRIAIYGLVIAFLEKYGQTKAANEIRKSRVKISTPNGIPDLETLIETAHASRYIMEVSFRMEIVSLIIGLAMAQGKLKISNSPKPKTPKKQGRSCKSCHRACMAQFLAHTTA